MRLKERIEQRLSGWEWFYTGLDRSKLENGNKSKAWSSKSAKPKEKSYLYNKIKEDYEKNFVIPELEKKKAKLEHLRSFYKPVSFTSILHFPDNKRGARQPCKRTRKTSPSKNPRKVQYA